MFTNLPIPEQEIIVVCAFTIVMGYNLLFMSYSSCSAFLYTAFNTMRKIITLYIYNMYDVHYKQNAYNSVCSEHDIKLFNQSGLLKLISLCVCMCVRGQVGYQL